ncbi:MAG: tetratricopeptide repeat protein, partial [Mucilaginibacter sp.]
TQLESFRRELRTDKGFTWESWDQAAAFCAQNKVNLDEALTWTDTSTGPNFGGSQSFQAWSTRAMVLDSLGRGTEAADIRKKALQYGDINELYGYARGLTQQKKGKEAFDVFKLNYDKHPNEYVTNMGMARGYSAIGDYKKALTYAQKAEPQATSAPRKATVAKIIKSLHDGKDIN